MKSRLRHGAAFLALWTLLVPTTLRAAAPAMRDVALTSGGAFRGQVVDPQGQPVAGVAVTLASQTGEQSQVATDKQGAFEFRNVRGGVYTVSTSAGGAAIRLWTAQTAPPKAAQAALLVHDSGAVRGQIQFRDVYEQDCLGNIFVAGVVITAITVPLALSNGSGS